MSLLLQEDNNRPEVSAGTWIATNAFFGLRCLLPPITTRWYGTQVPMQWVWSYPDILFDRWGVVASGEI